MIRRPKPPKMQRGAAVLLTQARDAVTGARAKTYGDARPFFRAAADYWTTYLRQLPGGQDVELSMHDVAAMMALFKVARIPNRPGYADNWRDLAGYGGLGAEVAGADLTV